MNSDKLKELIEKVPFSLFLCAYMGYLGFDYYNFNNDPSSPLLMKVREVEAAKQNKTKFDKKLKEFKVFAQTLEAKKGELRQLATELQGMKDSLSDSTDIPGFMKMTITEAKKVGLTIQSLKPLGSSPKEYYTEQTFSLKFRGLFVQIAAFLQRLANVTEIVRVDRFDIKPIASSQGKYVLLEGGVDIKTYKYLGSSADNMGKSDGSTPKVGKP